MKNFTSKNRFLLVFTLFSLTSFGQNTINDSLKEVKTEPHSNQVTTFNKKGVQTISVGQRRSVIVPQQKKDLLESDIQPNDPEIESINSEKEVKKIVAISREKENSREIYRFVNQRDIPKENIERFTNRVDMLYENIDSVTFDYSSHVFSIEFISSPSSRELKSVFELFHIYEYRIQ
jgi:hypothetical protein